jgi:hypothetical protein
MKSALEHTHTQKVGVMRCEKNRVKDVEWVPVVGWKVLGVQRTNAFVGASSQKSVIKLHDESRINGKIMNDQKIPPLLSRNHLISDIILFTLNKRTHSWHPSMNRIFLLLKHSRFKQGASLNRNIHHTEDARRLREWSSEVVWGENFILMSFRDDEKRGMRK